MAAQGQSLTYNERVNSLRGMLAQKRDKIANLLPQHINADRLLRVVMMSVERTPKLLDCTPVSVLRSVMEAAQLGLMIGPPLNHAHLVPFGNACQLIPDYRGLIHLAKNSGELVHVAVDVVCEKDSWTFYRDEQGDHFKHEPAWERGAVKGAYCVARFADGLPMIEVMSLSELDHIRAKSRAKNDGPWVTDTNEMFKKTVIKRASKKWPLSPEKAERFFKAVVKDNAVETGEDAAILDEPIDAEFKPVPPDGDAPKSRMDALADKVGADEPKPDEADRFQAVCKRISAAVDDDQARRDMLLEAGQRLDAEGIDACEQYVEAELLKLAQPKSRRASR